MFKKQYLHRSRLLFAIGILFVLLSPTLTQPALASGHVASTSSQLTSD